MAILHAVRACAPPDWVVGAGVIRNLVWDHLHGHLQPTPARDVDVAYFDPRDLSRESESRVEEQLRLLIPDVPWEVTNQAAVHLWYEEKFGKAIEPFVSIEDALASWPETATSVGVRLEPGGALTVVAPLGLEDLFQLRLRRNPRLVSREQFLARLREKKFTDVWPRVQAE